MASWVMASSLRNARVLARNASITLSRQMPISHAGSDSSLARSEARDDQAAMNTCWVTSSASSEDPSELRAIV